MRGDAIVDEYAADRMETVTIVASARNGAR